MTDPQQVTMFTIISDSDFDDDTGDNLYWHNDNGWVPLELAGRWTLKETATLHLPLGGEWKVMVIL